MVTELYWPTLPEPSRVVNPNPIRSRAVTSAPTLRVSQKPKRSQTPKIRKVFLDILIIRTTKGSKKMPNFFSESLYHTRCQASFTWQ